jgi:hypothetical protein
MDPEIEPMVFLPETAPNSVGYRFHAYIESGKQFIHKEFPTREARDEYAQKNCLIEEDTGCDVEDDTKVVHFSSWYRTERHPSYIEMLDHLDH